MKTHTLLTSTVAATLLLSATPAFAQNVIPTAPAVGATVSASASAGGTGVKASANLTAAKGRADRELTRRIGVLNDLNTKVQAMVKLTADEKASIGNSITSQISSLTTLQTQIDAETDITALKSDVKSITSSYRIFLLVVPQGRIVVAADKIATAATSLASLSAKLQTRITEATGDTAALSASLTDLNAKVADANVQASAAASEVANLTPDNGDSAKLQSNDQAIKDARAKVQAALKDIQGAQQDAHAIVNGLKLSVGAQGSASSSAQ